jgi:Mrp family chromosome partitioning ATPase/capsular polysaccharide biosynthesis protein
VADQNQSSVSLRHYAEILWRRKWLVVETAVIIPAIVIGVSFTQPNQYAATARLMAVSQSPSVSVAVGTNIDLSKPDEREMQTLASFVVTPEIAQRVSDQLGWPDDPATLMASTKAEADPNADIIAVTTERAMPAEAADLANAFAQQFVQWRKDTQQNSLDEAIKLLDDQIALASPGSAARTALVERRSQLEVLKALVSGGLTVGEAAQPPGVPSSPKPLRDGVLAIAAALVLGVGLAFLRDSLDVKVRSADEIAELTDLPVIGAIPEFRKSEKSPDKLIVLDDPGGPTAEAYRFLRTNLDFVNFNHDIKVVLVTSPLPAQGKSTTIANLAVALLRAGKRVAVVEGDLRRPALHRYFKIANARGVTNVVSGDTPLADAVQVLTFKDSSATVTTTSGPDATLVRKTGPSKGADLKLRVLPSGPLPPNPGEIVNSQQLADILETLKADSDYVLVDAPPMFAVGDAAAMADKVDGIIVILRLDETTADTLKNVEDFFRRVPTRALGLVVSGVPRGSKGKYYRYQEYYA